MRAGCSEESSSNSSQMCLCCSLYIGCMKAGNVSRCKTRRGIPDSAYKVSRDAVPSVFFFLNQTLKQMKKGGVHYTSHTRSLLLVLNFTSSSQGAELLFSSVPSSHLIRTYIHLSCYPVHRSFSCPSIYWEHVKSLHFSESPNSHP